MPALGTRLIGWFWSRPYLLLTFTALFWAGNSIVGRAARDVMPPVALAFWRWALALLLLLPFAWSYLRRDCDGLKANWKWALTLGILCIGTFNTLLYKGLQTSTAVNDLLLQSMQPALILMLGALVFGENVRIPHIIGICACQPVASHRFEIPDSRRWKPLRAWSKLSGRSQEGGCAVRTMIVTRDQCSRGYCASGRAFTISFSTASAYRRTAAISVKSDA